MQLAIFFIQFSRKKFFFLLVKEKKKNYTQTKKPIKPKEGSSKLRKTITTALLLSCLVPGLSSQAYSATVGASGMTGGPYELIEADNANKTQTTMLQTVNAVLQNHKALKVLQENRQVAIHELESSRAGYGPSVDITGNIGFTNQSNISTRAEGKDKFMFATGQVQLLITQPIWDGYATRSRVRASESLLRSVSTRVIDNATTLALDGIIAHVDLIWRRKNLQLADRNVQTHERILSLTRDRESTGADVLASVTQTQGRLVGALSTFEDTRTSLIQGENSYRRLTELPVPEGLGSVKQPLKMFTTPEEVLALAKVNNPKVIAYLEDVVTAQAEKELGDAVFHPTFNIEAGPSYSNNGYQYAGEEWNASFDVLGTMRWNIYNSGADVAASKAAAARVRESRQTAYSFMDDLDLDIKNSWSDYQTAIAQLAYHNEAITYNIQTRDAYMEQYIIGQRTLLDLLDAESELYNSEVQAITARANILISTYRLYALAGLLLPELNVSAEQVLVKPAE